MRLAHIAFVASFGIGALAAESPVVAISEQADVQSLLVAQGPAFDIRNVEAAEKKKITKGNEIKKKKEEREAPPAPPHSLGCDTIRQPSCKYDD